MCECRSVRACANGETGGGFAGPLQSRLSRSSPSMKSLSPRPVSGRPLHEREPEASRTLDIAYCGMIGLVLSSEYLPCPFWGMSLPSFSPSSLFSMSYYRTVRT
jgi:hypothetical protein